MLSDRVLRDGLKTVPDAAAVHALVANWQPLKTVA
jgi:PTS system nitrogen regulatory IIA component